VRLPLLALLSFILLGCGASDQKQAQTPCTGAGTCSTGTCVAGRCRPEGAAPTKSNSTRVVLVPRDFTVLTAENDHDASSTPEAVALGRASTGRALMLFRFVSTWREDADIESAFFVMDAIEGAPLPVAAPTVEIARILSPWSSTTTTWGRQPRLGLPEPAGTLRVIPSLPLRLDVTPSVRAWAKRERDDYGLALLVDGKDENGVLTSTGITKGLGPHLEVYLK
jgi:hypothetical protein